RIVGEHLPAPERVVIAGGTVDRHTHLDVLAVTLARGRREGRFDRLEDDLFVDAFLVRDGVHYHQYFLAHRSVTRSLSQLRDEPRLGAIFEREPPRLPFRRNEHRVVRAARDLARQPSAPVLRFLQLEAHRLADETLELLERAQAPVEPWRRNLEHVAARQRI